MIFHTFFIHWMVTGDGDGFTLHSNLRRSFFRTVVFPDDGEGTMIGAADDINNNNKNNKKLDNIYYNIIGYSEHTHHWNIVDNLLQWDGADLTTNCGKKGNIY